MEQVEQDFWDIVEGGDESVQVLYGADLDTRGGRSGFPVKKALRSKSGGHRTHVLLPLPLHAYSCEAARQLQSHTAPCGALTVCPALAVCTGNQEGSRPSC